MASLASVPQDIHYHILASLADFKDLSSTVLSTRMLHNAFQTNRRRVLSSVARNFLGGVFIDALLLARCQEKRNGSAALKVKGLSSSTIRLLVGNAKTIGELQTIMFGLLQDSSVDVQKKDTMAQFASAPPTVAASEPESIRFKSAAYRFCVFCLLQTAEARKAFLKRYPTIQVLELSHFVNALWALVCVIRGRALETDRDWNFLANVVSTGPEKVLELWKLKQEALVKPGWYLEDFKFELKDAGTRKKTKTHKKDGSNEDNENAADLMEEWCNLMDGYEFPPDATDAILDARHGQCVALLAASAGRPAKVVPETAGSDDDSDSSELGTESDGILGVVKEDCLEDPF
ncbi:hypothetical protein K438DRAFT_1973978 [Mycena galopus ATCC 62051]|nr:hypothetical protein K438DRAFT_1973978 [Mycena galopus ATCC 62051]